MKIYLVEEREMVSGSENMECYIVIHCSSEEKARTYCESYTKKYPFMSGDRYDKESWYWHVIREYELDNEDHQEVVAFYDWHGKEIAKQPLSGYTS